MRSRFDRSAIRKGLNVFFGLSVACIVVVFVFTDPGGTLKALSRVQPGFFALALLLAVADWFGGGLRLYVLTRGLTRPVSYWTSFRAALANTAMGAITPSQAGGGPAQVFILYRNGLPFAESMSASLMTFVVTMIFFVISAGLITFLGVNTSITDAGVRTLFRWGVSLFMLLGTTIMVFIMRPGWLRTVMRWIFNFLSLFRRDHFLRPGARAYRIMDGADEIHKINLHYFRRRFGRLAASVVMTAALFGFKCFIAYFIVRGLGIEAAVWEVVSMQVLILLAVYFFPTPGGTGAAELGSAVLMASIVPLGQLTVYVVLWRVVVMYIAVIIGSVIMLRAMGSDGVIETEGEYGVEKKIAVSGE